MPSTSTQLRRQHRHRGCERPARTADAAATTSGCLRSPLPWEVSAKAPSPGRLRRPPSPQGERLSFAVKAHDAGEGGEAQSSQVRGLFQNSPWGEGQGEGVRALERMRRHLLPTGITPSPRGKGGFPSRPDSLPISHYRPLDVCKARACARMTGSGQDGLEHVDGQATSHPPSRHPRESGDPVNTALSGKLRRRSSPPRLRAGFALGIHHARQPALARSS